MEIVRTRCKRLWNNLASLRDYNVKEWIRNDQTVIVTTPDKPGETMTLTPQKLADGFQALGDRKIKSKYGRDYELIDFKWVRDE